MKNKKSTKRALLASLMAMLLSISMLMGTTYAWFTDSVSSGSNVITTGNLDIEVEYTLDGENWNNLDGANDLFQKSYWEPGHTEVVALRITNKGTLALKYNANMNIIEETVGKNKDGGDIVLSEILNVATVTQQANQVGDILLGMVFGGSKNTDTGAVKPFKDSSILGADQELLSGDAHYVIITVDMPETVGNEANHDGTNVPTIEFGVNVLATQYTYENDSFGNDYDDITVVPVYNADEAQAALDNAAEGTIIQLMPNDYGTLEIRANIVLDGKAPVAGNANTQKVDYFTTKYTNEFVRTIENVTIMGTPGAKVDAIKFAGNIHKITGASGGTMYRFVEVKNLTIDSVEFTDASTVGAGAGFVSPIFMDLSNTRVDGLTVKNCKLKGAVNNMNFVYAYGNTSGGCDFTASLKNVVIENNTVSGIARLCELREAENVNIKGNNVADLTRELALLSNNAGKAYSGDINVIGNTADNVAIDYTAGGDNALVVRVGVGGDANIVVKDNVITNTTPIDVNDFVKVTGHTGTLTIVDNIAN